MANWSPTHLRVPPPNGRMKIDFSGDVAAGELPSLDEGEAVWCLGSAAGSDRAFAADASVKKRAAKRVARAAGDGAAVDVVQASTDEEVTRAARRRARINERDRAVPSRQPRILAQRSVVGSSRSLISLSLSL